MSRFTRYVCLPITPLFRRLRIPFTQRTVPVWLLLVIFGPLFLVGGGAAVVATNQPVFCASCHEMSLHYDTWRQSAHRNVGCEDCHVMPGMVNMFKSKINALRLVRAHAAGDVRAVAIQGHVPNASCKRCHTDTPELVTYHGLKITHRAHWELGVQCTFCHSRVVHGPKWLYTGVGKSKKVQAVSTAYKFTPEMATCYKCHDGKRAPNECTTCHVSLGERKPTAFDPEWVKAHQEEVNRSGKENCEGCHQTAFCDNCHRSANPHPADWVARHTEASRKDPTGCPACHLAPAERPPKHLANMAFCAACHAQKQQHAQADWQQVHGKESLANPASCQRCHTQSWCSACHSITKPHPPEWLARHSAEASRDPRNCQTCHTQSFCEACHKGKQSVPASHTRDWLTTHKDLAQRPGASCATCHKPDFCQACHAKKPPATHGRMWLSQHGTLSQVPGQACAICHAKSFCNKCHGMIMPHPTDWVKVHPKQAARKRAVCDQCHRKQGCEACHRGALPASHQPAGWMSKHGAQGKQPNATCSICHRTDFCNSCHGTSMPHPKAWTTQFHGKAAAKDRDTCLRCHKERDCTACHGLSMPHPDTWVAQHGKQAEAAPTKCAKCHNLGGHNQCTICHTGLAPPSHQADGWAEATGHAVAGANDMDLCTLCHGKDACNTCHASKRDKTKGK